MRIAREEIFGPLASIMPFDDIDEVTRRANRTEVGLGGGVWTCDVGQAYQLAPAMKPELSGSIATATPIRPCRSAAPR
jgi:aldehyde dehydrogenase (NAD+)